MNQVELRFLLLKYYKDKLYVRFGDNYYNDHIDMIIPVKDIISMRISCFGDLYLTLPEEWFLDLVSKDLD